MRNRGRSPNWSGTPLMPLVDASGSLADPCPLRSAPLRAHAPSPSYDAHLSLAPRRVLMTADAVGGVWRYAVDVSSALLRRNLDVTLAVMGPPPSSAQRSLAAALGVKVLTSPFKLEWMDAAWDDVDRAGEWLLDLERKLQPDLVHLNGFCHASLSWQAPVVVVAHSCVCSWWRSVHGVQAPDSWATYRTRVAAGLAAARIVIAPTAAMLGALVVEYGWTFRDARVIPNGRVDGNDAGEPLIKSPIVFTAGRVWDEAKNIAALCSIASSITWPVYVAGDACGPTGSHGFGISHGEPVTLLGQLEADSLGRWFNRAAIYAQPARYEPFGLSILEAAASGCALVLGDIASLRENWSDAAVFVAPEDRPALAATIQRLIDCEHERLRLGARARERARQFGVERTADAYVRAYGDACAHRPSPRDKRRRLSTGRGME